MQSYVAEEKTSIDRRLCSVWDDDRVVFKMLHVMMEEYIHSQNKVNKYKKMCSWSCTNDH